jgi:hypothetical protein
MELGARAIGEAMRDLLCKRCLTACCSCREFCRTRTLAVNEAAKSHDVRFLLSSMWHRTKPARRHTTGADSQPSAQKTAPNFPDPRIRPRKRLAVHNPQSADDRPRRLCEVISPVRSPPATHPLPSPRHGGGTGRSGELGTHAPPAYPKRRSSPRRSPERAGPRASDA